MNQNYIITDYVMVLPLPLPKPGLINEILIDFRAIADNLIRARSIDWVLGMPFPLPGPKYQARDAAIARSLHIVRFLEKKIDKAFGDYGNYVDVAGLQQFREDLEGHISAIPITVP